jgi:homogentisate 1,2-dioxygenase
MQSGMAAHVCLVTASMENEYFFSADSELLIVMQQGALEFATELGSLLVSPMEIAVIPRGMVFQVKLVDGLPARAFVCENYGGAFTLPERGPIGANGLANARDFKIPVAKYENIETECSVTVKWCGHFHRSVIGHSPLDVVAWHGNHVAYKYDLRRFSPVGAIDFDHPDPSIFTVLTAPSSVPGTANVDFVIFPERWLVAEDTFRPPWYHKNIMSEFMGNIHGVYDAKPSGFIPGGMSLHNMMLPHGPDRDAFENASSAELAPQKLRDTLSFMFETRLPQQLTAYATAEAPLQDDYTDCWQGLEKKFDGTPGTK